MSPPGKPGIPASVAITAMVSNAPDGSTIGHFTVVYDTAHLGLRVHVHAFSVVFPGAVLGEGAVLGDGASLDPGCELGAGAFLGPGARLLDRTRLPTSKPGKPAMVGEGTRIGGNAVVCGGITVGADAVVSAGESEEVQGDLEGRVEDDVPDGGTWMSGRLSGTLDGKTWE